MSTFFLSLMQKTVSTIQIFVATSYIATNIITHRPSKGYEFLFS